MTNKILQVLNILYKSIDNMLNHDGIEHAGYIAFMLLVSIFPFVIFILAFTSFIGASELGEKFIELAIQYLPDYSTESIRTRVNELVHTPPQGLLTLAVLGTVWTSSSFMECLRTILNKVYEVNSPPPYILRRLLSIVQFFVISAMISIAMFLLVIIPVGLSKLPAIMELLEKHKMILNFMRYTMIVAFLFLGVCTLYYIMPNIKLRFIEVIPGAFLTVLLWVSGGHLLSKYIIYYNQLNLIYGSLGSIIITLMFFYIINMIFIVGAEFNYLITKEFNKKSYK